MERREDEQVSGVIERHESVARLKPEEPHTVRKTEPFGRRMERPAHRVLTDDVERDVEPATHQRAERVEQHGLPLDRVQRRDVQQLERRHMRTRPPRRCEYLPVDADRDDVRLDAVLRRQLRLKRRADGDAGRQAGCGGNRQPRTGAELLPIVDRFQRHELATVAGDNRRDAKTATGNRRDESGWNCPIAVNDVERAVALDRRAHGAVLIPQPVRTTEVTNRRALQRIAARLVVIAQHVDNDRVLTRQPGDEPEQRWNDVDATTSIEATSGDERDAHTRL